MDGATPTFGRSEAVDQAAMIEAVRRAFATGTRADLSRRPLPHPRRPTMSEAAGATARAEARRRGMDSPGR
jgi:hypothetical protein